MTENGDRDPSRNGASLAGLLRANPEALLLIGAGLALLVGSEARRRPALRRAAGRAARDGVSSVRGHLPEGADMALSAMENPWALAGLGLAAGVALGAALPSDAMEDALFGEAREATAQRALRALNDQLTRLRAARDAATEKLKEEADSRALNAEGLKDLALKVAEAAKEGANAEQRRAESESDEENSVAGDAAR